LALLKKKEKKRKKKQRRRRMDDNNNRTGREKRPIAKDSVNVGGPIGKDPPDSGLERG
jgi:hypothetical protein